MSQASHDAATAIYNSVCGEVGVCLQGGQFVRGRGFVGLKATAPRLCLHATLSSCCARALISSSLSHSFSLLCT